MVEIVEAASDEVVEALRRLVPQLSASAHLPSRADVEEVISSPATRLLIARGGGRRIIGTLTLVLFPIPTGRRAWVEDVIVDEEARGMGVGRALLEEALRLADEEGAKTVDLTSGPSRSEAHALYLRSGFTQRDTNVYRYGS